MIENVVFSKLISDYEMKQEANFKGMDTTGSLFSKLIEKHIKASK